MGALFRHLPHLSVTGDDEPFLVPDLPHPIHMVRCELPDFLRGETPITSAMDDLREGESDSLGVVVNSFAKIESAYADLYLKANRMWSWFVGPVALPSTNAGDLAAHGGDDHFTAANCERCLSWLETKEPNSVVYVCFGSWSHPAGEQLKEMALALELAGHPFVWVVREATDDEWMPEGFERRLDGGEGAGDKELGPASGDAGARGGGVGGGVRDALRMELDAGGGERGASHGYVAAIDRAVHEQEADGGGVKDRGEGHGRGAAAEHCGGGERGGRGGGDWVGVGEDNGGRGGGRGDVAEGEGVRT